MELLNDRRGNTVLLLVAHALGVNTHHRSIRGLHRCVHGLGNLLDTLPRREVLQRLIQSLDYLCEVTLEVRAPAQSRRHNLLAHGQQLGDRLLYRGSRALEGVGKCAARSRLLTRNAQVLAVAVDLDLALDNGRVEDRVIRPTVDNVGTLARVLRADSVFAVVGTLAAHVGEQLLVGLLIQVDLAHLIKDLGHFLRGARPSLLHSLLRGLHRRGVRVVTSLVGAVESEVVALGALGTLDGLGVILGNAIIAAVRLVVEFLHGVGVVARTIALVLVVVGGVYLAVINALGLRGLPLLGRVVAAHVAVVNRLPVTNRSGGELSGVLRVLRGAAATVSATRVIALRGLSRRTRQSRVGRVLRHLILLRLLLLIARGSLITAATTSVTRLYLLDIAVVILIRPTCELVLGRRSGHLRGLVGLLGVTRLYSRDVLLQLLLAVC